MSVVDPLIEAAAKRVFNAAYGNHGAWNNASDSTQQQCREMAIAARTDPPPRKSLGEIFTEARYAFDSLHSIAWSETNITHREANDAAALIVAEHVRRGLIEKLKVLQAASAVGEHLIRSHDAIKCLAEANLEELP